MVEKNNAHHLVLNDMNKDSHASIFLHTSSFFSPLNVKVNCCNTPKTINYLLKPIKKKIVVKQQTSMIYITNKNTAYDDCNGDTITSFLVHVNIPINFVEYIVWQL